MNHGSVHISPRRARPNYEADIRPRFERLTLAIKRHVANPKLCREEVLEVERRMSPSGG
jgi:hypothetical protein